MRPYDADFWAHQHADSYAECIDRRDQPSTSRYVEGACRNCDKKGHFIADCPFPINPREGKHR